MAYMLVYRLKTDGNEGLFLDCMKCESIKPERQKFGIFVYTEAPSLQVNFLERIW